MTAGMEARSMHFLLARCFDLQALASIVWRASLRSHKSEAVSLFGLSRGSPKNTIHIHENVQNMQDMVLLTVIIFLLWGHAVDVSATGRASQNHPAA